MARTFEITTEGNAAKIVVDGNEISDVIECNLRKNNEGTILEIKIAITGDVPCDHKPIEILCAQTYGITSEEIRRAILDWRKGCLHENG